MSLRYNTVNTAMVVPERHPCVPMQATVPVLWLMPALQLLLLLFFTSIAVSHWVYSWVLLAPCLITGDLRLRDSWHNVGISTRQSMLAIRMLSLRLTFVILYGNMHMFELAPVSCACVLGSATCSQDHAASGCACSISHLVSAFCFG